MVARMLTTAAVTKLKATAKTQEIPDAGAPGLRLVIQPSGAKSWAMRFRRPGGKQGNLTLGKLDTSGRETDAAPVIGEPLTVAGARALANEISRQRARDLDVVAQQRAEKQRRRAVVQERGANTFAAAVQDFIEGHHAKGTDRRPRDWREVARTLGLDYPLEGDEGPATIKGGLCDRWRDKPVAEIDGDDIFHMIEEAKVHGIPGMGRKNNGVSKARGRKMAAALGGLFGWLLSKRWVKVNPCAGIGRQAAPAARDRVLNVKADVRNADELRWLWAASDNVGHPFGPLCKLLLLTGCRLNEIARMSRAELSDDSATLRLPGERTKNSLPHDVPLPPLAREILNGLPQFPGCEFVFSTAGKTPISGFSKYKTRFDAAMLAEAKKEKGKVAPWRLHDFRRTCATGMAGIGIAPHVIEAVLNHVSGARASVAGTYNREAYEPEKRAALARWTDHIVGIVSGRAANVVPLRGRPNS
jgi:integrase